MTTRTWIGHQLRRIADHIDPTRAPRFTGLCMTFESGHGVDVHQEGRGCPLWYLGDGDYELAHTEARTR